MNFVETIQLGRDAKWKELQVSHNDENFYDFTAVFFRGTVLLFGGGVMDHFRMYEFPEEEGGELKNLSAMGIQSQTEWWKSTIVHRDKLYAFGTKKYGKALHFRGVYLGREKWKKL